MPKNPRVLKDIEANEISLVKKAANKRKFLFVKQDSSSQTKKTIKVTIESDGSAEGTLITVNGEELAGLQNFNFSFYRGDELGSNTNPVSCSYSRYVDGENGFKQTQSFYLSKGEMAMRKSELLKKVEAYTGGAGKIDLTKSDGPEALVAAVDTLELYREEFPDDLAKAVVCVLKESCLDKGEVLDAANPEHVTALRKAVEDLQSQIAKLGSPTTTVAKGADKGNDNKDPDLKTQLAQLTERIEKLQKGQSEDDISKTLKGLGERLDAIEEAAGIRKSVTAQDGGGTEEDDPDDKGKGKDANKWPSFSGAPVA